MALSRGGHVDKPPRRQLRIHPFSGRGPHHRFRSSAGAQRPIGLATIDCVPVSAARPEVSKAELVGVA